MPYSDTLMERLKEKRGTDTEFRILIVRRPDLAKRIGWVDMYRCRIRERRSGGKWEIIGAGIAQTLDEALKLALENAVLKREYRRRQ